MSSFQDCIGCGRWIASGLEECLKLASYEESNTLLHRFWQYRTLYFIIDSSIYDKKYYESYLNHWIIWSIISLYTLFGVSEKEVMVHVDNFLIFTKGAEWRLFPQNDMNPITVVNSTSPLIFVSWTSVNDYTSISYGRILIRSRTNYEFYTFQECWLNSESNNCITISHTYVEHLEHQSLIYIFDVWKSGSISLFLIDQ